MRWWGYKPWSVTAQTLDSDAFFTIAFLSSPSTPQFLLPFSGLFFLFIPPPGPIPYLPRSFTCRCRFYLSFHPLLPPHLSLARSERPPGRRPCLPDYTALLRYPPMVVIPRSSSHKPVSSLHCLVAFPLLYSTCAIRSLLVPGFSLPGFPSSL